MAAFVFLLIPAPHTVRTMRETMRGMGDTWLSGCEVSMKAASVVHGALAEHPRIFMKAASVAHGALAEHPRILGFS